MTKEETFRLKAEKGFVCLNGDCPQRENCLRWQLREYTPRTLMVVTSVNPRFREAKEKCPMFLSDEKIVMAKGMVHFYDEMPRRMEERVKGTFIAHFGRTIYYEYRNGKRLLTPELQAYVKQVCQECGWTQEPQYDEFVKDYVWG